MLSDAIEGERNHLESTPIFSPSMPSPDVKFKLVFKPILDPYDSPYLFLLRHMVILEIHRDI
jgi:hypothetical protein